MKVEVYVEGESDRLAMRELLKEVISAKRQQGIAIDFFMAAKGDSKKWLIYEAPRRAVNILRHQPQARVVVIPDVYPPNKGEAHTTCEELRAVILRQFTGALRAKQLDDDRLVERFHVFCFKHDLEALLLALPEALAVRLAVEQIERTWRLPVEDQNHNLPPKRIVEALFIQQGQTYNAVVDAPLILSPGELARVRAACPQCFQPFVEFLENLQVN